MTLAEYELEQEIGTHWQPLVQAAGMYDPALKPANLFMLAGAIMHDREVSQRHAERRGAWLDVLNEMSDLEKAALKGRIVAKYGRK